MNVPAEYPLMAMLVTGIGAVFALYQRGVSQALAAKDQEIAWLRSQLEPWTQIARSAVSTAEKLSETTTGRK